MKKFIKATLVMVMAIILSVPVLAATPIGEKIVEVALRGDITIILNDRQLDLTDANGDIVEPILYNGTTYLPIRAISENQGLAVAWDGDTKSVILGTSDTKVSLSADEFKDHDRKIPDITDGFRYYAGGSDRLEHNGLFYTHGILASLEKNTGSGDSSDKFYLQLDKGSSKFGGVFYMEEDAKAYSGRETATSVYFSIPEDATKNAGLVLHSYLYIPGNTVEFEFDTMGAEEIQIMFNGDWNRAIIDTEYGILEPYYVY